MFDQGEYLKTGDVARRLRVDRSTIHRLVKSGGITPLFLTPKGHPRFSPSVVEALAERLTPNGIEPGHELRAAKLRVRRGKKRGQR